MNATRLSSHTGCQIATVRPFLTNSSTSRRPQLATRSTRSSSIPMQQFDHLALLQQLLGSAVDRLLGNTKPGTAAADIRRPCPVSYTDRNSRNFTPMSEAARLAFAALEQDDELEQQAALGALCLVTYSDDDEDSSSTLFPARKGSATSSPAAARAMRAFAALNAMQNGELHEAVSSEDIELAGGVMDTLCIVTYEDDDE